MLPFRRPHKPEDQVPGPDRQPSADLRKVGILLGAFGATSAIALWIERAAAWLNNADPRQLGILTVALLSALLVLLVYRWLIHPWLTK